jgi:3-phytase
VRVARRIAQGLGLALVPAALGAWLYYRPPGASVAALVETAPVHSPRDAADDSAIWVDPVDPAASLVIGTDKKNGLLVYDLEGAELQRFENGAQNNVDLRDGLPFRGGAAALVVTSATAAHGVFLYRVDAAAHRLEALPAATFTVGLEPSGIALYRGREGRIYCFVNGEGPEPDEAGVVEQWELRIDSAGESIAAALVRRFVVGGRVEGCACDDAQGFLFVSEERRAVWRYGAEPDAGEGRVWIERVGLLGRVRPDAEGIALYARPDGGGFLIVSSQGSNDFTVYDRRPPHAYRGRFGLRAGADIDAVSHTDGIEACATPLGPRFPAGLFVAQDDVNDGTNQNFKLASWRDIAAALGLDER